jgi:hypothetical protein
MGGEPPTRSIFSSSTRAVVGLVNSADKNCNYCFLHATEFSISTTTANLNAASVQRMQGNNRARWAGALNLEEVIDSAHPTNEPALQFPVSSFQFPVQPSTTKQQSNKKRTSSFPTTTTTTKGACHIAASRDIDDEP